MTTSLQFKRIVLKLSGEALLGERPYGIDPVAAAAIASEIKEVVQLDIQVAVVMGGGNIFRGMAASSKGLDRTTGDYMGMLATLMNGMALQDALEKQDIPTRLQTAIAMQEVAEPFIRRRAIRHLEKGRVVIFAGGTGSPFFTTDTSAALRATEIGAAIILKATKVDGVYSSDPVLDPKAKKFSSLKYIEVLNKNLRVMDATAISLCMENNIPIIVFNMAKHGNIKRVLQGEKIGTIVEG